MDPAYQNANPYMQHPMGPGGQHSFDSRQSFQPSELGGSEPSEMASNEMVQQQGMGMGGEGEKEKGKAGPPVHPGPAPVEMPTEQYK